jgi:hypothetical protein
MVASAAEKTLPLSYLEVISYARNYDSGRQKYRTGKEWQAGVRKAFSGCENALKKTVTPRTPNLTSQFMYGLFNVAQIS